MMHATLRCGDPGRPWLLLVHGMLTSARHWEPNLPELERHFNLARVDLPGHGRSPAPADIAAITADNLIAGFEALRRDLGAARWFVCGQSFGGGLTLNYARRHPDRVIAQAFTNARVVMRDNDHPEEIAARQARLASFRQEGPDAMRRERFHPRFAHRFPPALREALAADADRIDLGCYAQILGEVMPALSLRNVLDGAPLVPTILINGRHERIFQPVRDELVRRWPGLAVADLDGGHSVNIENPDGFARTLIGFFAAQGACEAQAGDSITKHQAWVR